MRIVWSVLLYDFGYHKQAVGGGGSVAERFFVDEAGPEFVGTGHIDERKGVGSEFDIADVDFLEFFDVTKNITQLHADFLLFFRG